MSQRLSSILDKAAIMLSGLCMVHCLAGAVLLTAFAAGSEWLDHDIHLVGLTMALPLAAVALWRGVAVHGRLGVAVLGALGLGLMTVSLFIAHGGRGELLASMVGVMSLGAAHYWNMRASRN